MAVGQTRRVTSRSSRLDGYREAERIALLGGMLKQALHMSVREFCHGVKTNRVFSDLEQAFFEVHGRTVGWSEKASWSGSLPRLSGVLELAGLTDTVHIALEVPVPYYSNRIDAVLYGHDKNNNPALLLVELKQWSDAKTDLNGKVSTQMGGRIVSTTHPSAQVDAYRRHLMNFIRACYNAPPIRIACCAYAHNYRQRTGALFEPQFADVIERAPIFCAGDAELLASFIRAQIGNDHGSEIYDRIRIEGLSPSPNLIGIAAEMIRRQNVFTMLDEQIPAQRNIVRALTKSIKRRRKSIILIDGGPGTGKSVIALDAFGHALREEKSAFLVSGSAAFTHGVRRLLGPDLASLVRFTDSFWDQPENSIDVLVVDEAHRIRSKSQPRVPAAQRPTIPQLEELVRAAKVTVLFMDTNQIIDPDECGDPDQVVALARKMGADFGYHRLHAQFRCDGSDEYLKWADELFDLNGSAEPRVIQCPKVFDFDVFDSPQILLSWVRLKNSMEPNSARIAAGWCWPWSDPESDGSLVNDIVIGDFAFPWELKNDKRGKRGIPQAKYWAVDPAGVDQAGTVYSVQGFEFRHVGLIMGPDLVIRDGKWRVNPRANFRKSLRGKSPDVASIYIRRIYRTLFTRPLRSLRVYSVDAETRMFLRSRIRREYPTN